MKKIFFLSIILVIMFISCGEYNKADADLQRKTDQFMQEANAEVGMPAIKNFQERKLAKMIFELRDKEDLICYAYITNMQGELIFLGKCIGFGLPYSVQYTNPEKISRQFFEGVAGSYVEVLPQADPNGLFMPTGLSATWLMMLDPKTNEPRPVYIEPQIIVSPFPLK